jgi:hypothetical protein
MFPGNGRVSLSLAERLATTEMTLADVSNLSLDQDEASTFPPVRNTPGRIRLPRLQRKVGF